MPCRDDYPPEPYNPATDTTRLLCMQCKFNEKHGYAIHPEVQVWLTEHQKKDIARREQILGLIKETEEEIAYTEGFPALIKRRSVLLGNEAKRKQIEDWKKQLEEDHIP